MSKDEYKEILHEALPDLTRVQAGPLSFELTYHVAAVALRAGVICMLETHFDLGVSEGPILTLARHRGAQLLQVHCQAPVEVLQARHADRVAAGEHPHIHLPGLWEQLPAQACVRPHDLDAPLLTVDATREVDLPAVAAWVRAQAAAPPSC